MKTAFGYVRVSGKGQLEGNGEDRQLEAIKLFCYRNNLEFHSHVFDKGISGTVEGLDRPAFGALVEAIARRKEIDLDGCIIVERMDRLARDLMVQEFLLRECRERKISVYAADRGELVNLAGDADEDPTRTLIRQVIGALSQWEKTTLVRKLRAARRQKKAKYGTCEGAKPYGDNEMEKKIQACVLVLYDKGFSLRKIALALNAEGWKPRLSPKFTKWSVKGVLASAQKQKEKVACSPPGEPAKINETPGTNEQEKLCTDLAK